MQYLSPRQIHLDFHTAGDIPDVAEGFNADAFAKTFKDTHVTSVTVFARCHHGYLYYPSKNFPERIHPTLTDKNLLTEQIDALHRHGLNAPVYITVQWDYYTATRRPEWLIRGKNGEHESTPFTEPGFYQSLCINTGYGDFLAAQTLEVIELLGEKLDGFFFDIVAIKPCYCSSCRALMNARGIDVSDDNNVKAFAAESIHGFKERMTALVREHNKDCTIFYNMGHIGPCTAQSAGAYTHFELESLPSGSWGYLHFPITARYARTFGIDCMGMTGKFHTEWGDFHSLKNLAALEFECFRMLSFGFAASIGDQLEPNGRLNPAAYRLIGKVYKRYAECEPWGRPSTHVAEAAVLTPETIYAEHRIPDSVMGAAQMLEELSLQFDIITEDNDFSKYKLLILPDDMIADSALQQKLDRYAADGGAILACCRGGADEAGAYPSCYGALPGVENEFYPDFIITEGALANGLEEGNEYVVYKQGLKITPASAQIILKARAPYYPRKGNKFCSHRYTPSANGDPYPAALQNGRVILFAHPLFIQYRHNAPLWCKKLIANTLDLLLPERLVRHNGPSTMTVNLLHQPQHERYAAHVLSYIPVRKSATIDIIEERTKLYNINFKFNLPEKIKSARIVPENIPLEIENGTVNVPEIDGYTIIELKY